MVLVPVQPGIIPNTAGVRLGRGGVAVIPPLLSFADLTVSSDGGYFLDPVTPQVIGGFGANVIPEGVISGRNYAGVLASFANIAPRSQEMDTAPWTTSVSTVAARTDPVGGSTAWKHISNLGSGGSVYQGACPFDAASTYVLWFFAKADEFDWVKLYSNKGAVHCNAWFDLTNETTGTVSGFDSAGITPWSDGWKLCWAVLTRTGAGNQMYHLSSTDANNVITNGDGTSGVIFWNPQAVIGTYPGPIIKTVASAVTRAADSVYWLSAGVPAAFYTGKWSVKYIPYLSSAEAANALMIFRSGPDVDFLDYDNAAGKFKVKADNVEKVLTAACTWSRYQELTITVDCVAGTVTLAGFTTGNGVHSGTPWAWATQNVYWGSSAGTNHHVDGLLSEPYA